MQVDAVVPSLNRYWCFVLIWKSIFVAFTEGCGITKTKVKLKAWASWSCDDIYWWQFPCVLNHRTIPEFVSWLFKQPPPWATPLLGRMVNLRPSMTKWEHGCWSSAGHKCSLARVRAGVTECRHSCCYHLRLQCPSNDALSGAVVFCQQRWTFKNNSKGHGSTNMWSLLVDMKCESSTSELWDSTVEGCL